MTGDQRPCQHPRCEVLIWWNPRLQRWLHTFENGNHEPRP